MRCPAKRGLTVFRSVLCVVSLLLAPRVALGRLTKEEAALHLYEFLTKAGDSVGLGRDREQFLREAGTPELLDANIQLVGPFEISVPVFRFSIAAVCVAEVHADNGMVISVQYDRDPLPSIPMYDDRVEPIKEISDADRANRARELARITLEQAQLTAESFAAERFPQYALRTFVKRVSLDLTGDEAAYAVAFEEIPSGGATAIGAGQGFSILVHPITGHVDSYLARDFGLSSQSPISVPRERALELAHRFPPAEALNSPVESIEYGAPDHPSIYPIAAPCGRVLWIVNVVIRDVDDFVSGGFVAIDALTEEVVDSTWTQR